jgi:hypothetical protein
MKQILTTFNFHIVRLTHIFLACAISFSIGCQKEGPEGPRGPQGEQGEQGDKGDPVTINVLSFDVLGSDWVQQGQFNSPNFRFSFDQPWSILDGQNFRNYVLLGYVDVGQGYHGLPYILTFSDYFTSIDFGWRSGHVFVSWRDSDLRTLPPGSTVSFKFIAIEAARFIDEMKEWSYEDVLLAL